VIAASAKRASLDAADHEVNKRVEAAVDQAPYLYAHVTATTRDGIVTLRGMVGGASDLQDVLRITSRVNGVKNVVDELEIWQFGSRSM
jgi:osmotically-inducible protein OsmY